MSRSARKLRSLFLLATGGCVSFSAMCLYNGNEHFYRKVAMPLVHNLTDAETAHKWAVRMAKWQLVPNLQRKDDPVLHTNVLGMKFENPIGLSAGFDKDCEAVHGLFACGFGFIEVGSITPEFQEGNPKPRIFRLSADSAIINRCGFNSKGHEFARVQLKRAMEKGGVPGVVGVSLGKNKSSDDALKDYVLGVKLLGPLADYLVVNVSSPNTPGLRQLQEKRSLENLLTKVAEARNSLPGYRPLIFLKISPDLSLEWKRSIASVVTNNEVGVDGLIISNTTTGRPSSLKSQQRDEVGGLSGAPLKDISTALIREMYRLTDGKVPIVGVGGVFTGADAYEKIRAGASLVQVYTVLAFEGPPAINRIKRELQELLLADGFSSVSQAVGTDNKI